MAHNSASSVLDLITSRSGPVNLVTITRTVIADNAIIFHFHKKSVTTQAVLMRRTSVESVPAEPLAIVDSVSPSEGTLSD